MWRVTVVSLVALLASCGGCENTVTSDLDAGGGDRGTTIDTDGGSTTVDATGTDAVRADTGGGASDAARPDLAGQDVWGLDTGTLYGPDGGITRLEYCQGEGPPIIVSDQGSGGVAVCTGDLAQVTFMFAICSCESPTGTDELFTDAFDSTQGPYQPGGLGGSVGTNGSLGMTNKATLGGSLWMSGATPAVFTDDLRVSGELHAAGNFTGAFTDIGLSAWVGGDVTVSALTVGGDLTVPAGSSISGNQSIGGSLVRAPVSVPQPCRCDPSDQINIAGFVEAHRNLNDNAEIGLDADALVNVTSAVVLNLPCGRFFLDGVSGTSDITIAVEDRTALFVGGDIGTTGQLRIELAEGAEVDLFVQGGITATNELYLGSERNPARVRLYVGGSGPITFTGTTVVAGNFYAPSAEIIVTDSLDVYGSIFARKLTFTNKLRVHYDRAVLWAGEACGEVAAPDGGVATPDAARPDLAGTDTAGVDAAQPDAAGSDAAGPAPLCVDCYDCGGQACIDGQCSSCSNSAECCPPLICNSNGVCAFNG